MLHECAQPVGLTRRFPLDMQQIIVDQDCNRLCLVGLGLQSSNATHAIQDAIGYPVTPLFASSNVAQSPSVSYLALSSTEVLKAALPPNQAATSR